MESYRSGHNGAVLKTVRAKVHRGSNPLLSAMKKESQKALFFHGGEYLSASLKFGEREYQSPLALAPYLSIQKKNRHSAVLFYYHLFSTFSAKPGKSLISITVPSSSTALPVNRPKT